MQSNIVPVPVFANATPPAPTPVPTLIQAPPANFGMPPQKPKKNGSGILFVGIVLCTVALVALAAILYLLFGQQKVVAPEPPAITEVESAFKDATIKAPSLENFAYVKTGELSGPELSDFKAGAVTEDSSAKGTFICNGEAKATYTNSSIKITVPVTIKFTHGKDATKWTPGGAESGSPTGTPTGPADVEAMVKNIQTILKSYKQEVATQFVGASVTPEANLTEKGGTVIFGLTKETESGTKSCAVNTDVSWGSSGWQVKVTSVDGLEEPTPNPEPEAASKPTLPTPSGGSSGGSDSDASTPDKPKFALDCNPGDLVQLPGTIQVQANGSILLKTDVILVNYGGRKYVVSYFEIQGAGSWQNGQHVTIIGSINNNGTNSLAPLVISTSY